MQQIEAIAKIYSNFEKLRDDFVDFPETDEAMENLREYITQKYFGDNPEKAERQWIGLEEYVMRAAFMNERQGFIYGFQYAARLLVTDGKGAAVCME